MLMSKSLEHHLHIYDTRQQEARLRWLLVKEFGHPVPHSISKSWLVDEPWHGTCIIWQQGVWMYWGDVIFFISIIMFLSHDFYDGGVRRQQELLLLWLLLGEYGLYFSHTLQHVSGGRDGTIKVKIGYPSALEYQEVLPLWKESPIYSSIMVDDFDISHVKEWSYEMTGALLQRPTTLSLGSLGLLMECS